jgi:hypothetical protein
MVHVKNERPADDSLTNELLVAEGYKLVEDAWKDFGRRTYLHDDDADRDYIKALARRPQSAGWQTDTRKLRTFLHPGSNHEIELEPGGSEATGHFLHHMKPKPSKVRRSGTGTKQGG